MRFLHSLLGVVSGVQRHERRVRAGSAPRPAERNRILLAVFLVIPETPVRIEYRLTAKGRALGPVVKILSVWGGKWIESA